jgi:hypothetical protein
VPTQPDAQAYTQDAADDRLDLVGGEVVGCGMVEGEVRLLTGE